MSVAVGADQSPDDLTFAGRHRQLEPSHALVLAPVKLRFILDSGRRLRSGFLGCSARV